jgi:hypothetical protein
MKARRGSATIQLAKLNMLLFIFMLLEELNPPDIDLTLQGAEQHTAYQNVGILEIQKKDHFLTEMAHFFTY